MCSSSGRGVALHRGAAGELAAGRRGVPACAHTLCTGAPPSAPPRCPPAVPCSMLGALCSDPRNIVYIVSGRGRAELDAWFGCVVRAWGAVKGAAGRRNGGCGALLPPSPRGPGQPGGPRPMQRGTLLSWESTSCPAVRVSRCPAAQENLGIAAEHGWFWRPNARSEWQARGRPAQGRAAACGPAGTTHLAVCARTSAACTASSTPFVDFSVSAAGARPRGAVWVEGHCRAHPAGGP